MKFFAVSTLIVAAAAAPAHFDPLASPFPSVQSHEFAVHTVLSTVSGFEVFMTELVPVGPTPASTPIGVHTPEVSALARSTPAGAPIGIHTPDVSLKQTHADWPPPDKKVSTIPM